MSSSEGNPQSGNIRQISNNYDPAEEVNVDHQLNDLAKSIQDTRERMIEGFGKFETAVERTRSDIIERISTTDKDLNKQITSTKDDLSKQIASTKDDLNGKLADSARTSSNRSWWILGILVAVIVGAASIATMIVTP